jgi:hypothetical protein
MKYRKKECQIKIQQKVNIFQFTPSSTTDLTMQQTQRKPQTNFLPRTPKPLLSPAAPLENPQSYTHEVKDRSHTLQSPATNSSHPLPKNVAHSKNGLSSSSHLRAIVVLKATELPREVAILPGYSSYSRRLENGCRSPQSWGDCDAGGIGRRAKSEEELNQKKSKTVLQKTV